MRAITWFIATSSLALFLTACGGGEEGPSFGAKNDTPDASGSGSGGDTSSNGGGSNAGGATSGNGGASNGSGGTSNGTTGGVSGSTGGVDGGGTATGGANGTTGGASNGTGGTGAGGGTAGSGGGTASGGATNGDGGTVTCGGATCASPATCDTTQSPARCVCPAGYDDPNGDGSVCLAQNGTACAADGDCTSGHCVGGGCCAVACDAPAACEQIPNTVCINGTTCRYGKQSDNTPCDDGDKCTNDVCFNGSCVVDTTKDCDDADKCTDDTCDPATGNCAHAAIDVATICNDNNPCTSDTCSATLGCQHADNNAASCTDGNACTTDVCSAGLCVSTPKNCTNLDTDCTTGVCSNGTCAAQPKNVNGACDDGIDACDSKGLCNASGQCIGQNDACGTLAASCTLCTSGTDCYQGRLCTCKTASPQNKVVNGVCVPDTNECNAAPCVAGATCTDPTPTGTVTGDVKCTCPTGYTGDGKKTGTGCTDINECSGANPCGSGVASNGCNGLSPAGSYSCTCKAGYKSVPTATGPICACDMGGTYALVTTTMVSWDAIVRSGTKAIEESPAAGVPSYSWALRYQTVQSNGSMVAQTIPCGGAAPAVCDLVFHFAHAQYQPDQVWGKPKTYTSFPTVTVPLSTVYPGGSYTEPQSSALMGIALDDPAGAWPPCRNCIGVNVGSQCTCNGVQYTVTNKATWVDADDDKSSGVTTVDVSRGGEVLNNSFPDPPLDYTEPSECPRLSGGTKYNYSEWPGLTASGVGFRAYQWYGGSRVQSALKSTSITFDGATNSCVMAGTMIGPDNGLPHTDARVAGCETCSDFNPFGCTPADPCNSDETDSYDSVSQTQKVQSIAFNLVRMSSIDLGPVLAMADGPAKESAINLACAEVRSTYCPSGKNCTQP